MRTFLVLQFPYAYRVAHEQDIIGHCSYIFLTLVTSRDEPHDKCSLKYHEVDYCK